MNNSISNMRKEEQSPTYYLPYRQRVCPTSHMEAIPDHSLMQALFALCRSNNWLAVEDQIVRNPLVCVTPMIMVNNISTTILHQAITSKGDTKARAAVIKTVLRVAPKSAAIKNGYGSLPLHVVSQRNIKMDVSTKEAVIYSLINTYPTALVTEGGVGRRTPLHIAFTDYISPQLAKIMIAAGPEATTMKDKKGWLPIHVACSRHCSPEKLYMLLRRYPNAIHNQTNDRKTPLDLAIATATKSHPNFALIHMLKREQRLQQHHQQQQQQQQHRATAACQPETPLPDTNASSSSSSSSKRSCVVPEAEQHQHQHRIGTHWKRRKTNDMPSSDDRLALGLLLLHFQKGGVSNDKQQAQQPPLENHSLLTHHYQCNGDSHVTAERSVQEARN